MSRGVSLDFDSRPVNNLDLLGLNNYPDKKNKLDVDKLVENALQTLKILPKTHRSVPKDRLTLLELELLAHFNYIKNNPSTGIVEITDKFVEWDSKLEKIC